MTDHGVLTSWRVLCTPPFFPFFPPTRFSSAFFALQTSCLPSPTSRRWMRTSQAIWKVSRRAPLALVLCHDLITLLHPVSFSSPAPF